ALLKATKDALVLHPEHPQFHFFKGEAHATLGDDPLAIRSWRRASEVSPSWILPMLRSANVQLQAGRHQEALALVDGALRRKPNSLTAAITYSEILSATLKEGDKVMASSALEFVRAIQEAVP